MEEDVLRAQGGDRSAFDRLVAPFIERVRLSALKSVRSEMDADDILQGVLISAWLKLGQFSGRSTFSTWLYTITRNEIVMWHRSRSRRSKRFAGNIPAEMEFECSNPKPDEVLWFREVCRRVGAASASMPDKYSCLIDMAMEDGRSSSSIASDLGLSLSGAKTRMHRARALLRGFLDQDGVLLGEKHAGQ